MTASFARSHRSPGLALALAIAFCASALSYTNVASADDTPISRTGISRDLRSYYVGERTASGIVLSLGVLEIGAGIALVMQDTDFGRGMGWSMLGLGVVESLGALLYIVQVQSEIAHYSAALERDPEAFQREEITHMHGTTSRFSIYRIAELALVIGGVGVAAYGFAAGQDTFKGIGIGVASCALPLFAIDTFNNSRAGSYENSLRRFQPSLTLQSGAGERPWLLGITGRF